MKQKIKNYVEILLVYAAVIFVLWYFHHRDSKTHAVEQPVVTTQDTIPKFFNLSAEEGLMDALIYYDIKHPDIVYAQAILETGHFKSIGCTQHNNLFGLYDSKAKRYCRFKHWTESVVSYKTWIQRRYKPPEDYYVFLKRINYAVDPQYIKKVKTIVNKRYDKRRSTKRDSIS
jgi:hypothetical protein